MAMWQLISHSDQARRLHGNQPPGWPPLTHLSKYVATTMLLLLHLLRDCQLLASTKAAKALS
jgi:hypothetical protein